MSEILFQITKDQLESGLRGVPVGYCVTSRIDPQKGLFYVDRELRGMIDWTPEAVIYLLYHGKEGSKKEIEGFSSDLKKRARCSVEAIAAVQRLPSKGHPMELFPAALILLGVFESKRDYREDCLNLIAKLPHLVAALINFHTGWGDTPLPDPSLGYMENFVAMLQVPGIDKGKLIQPFKLFNILHYDHGGGNLSTFVGKAVASGLEGMYGSIAAAMCALAGPRHGRANQDCLEFVQSVLAEVGETATVADVETLLRRRLAMGALVYGFGHAVLRLEDPRATIFYEYAKANHGDHPLVKIALLLREAGSKILAENPKIADPHPNVDAISGTVLTAAGFPYPDYYTILFGLARAVGIAIQIVYERCEARGGKGTPIIRPAYLYKPRSVL